MALGTSDVRVLLLLASCEASEYFDFGYLSGYYIDNE